MSKSDFFSRPNPWGLSPEQLEAELKAEFDELEEDRTLADRESAWLFFRNLAIMAEEEAEEADPDN